MPPSERAGARGDRGDRGAHYPPERRGQTAIDGALALIAILLVTQMWLLTATLESYLAGHHDVALPGVLISGVLALACFGLYLFIRGVDRESRRG
jgi:hypothetical protein